MRTLALVILGLMSGQVANAQAALTHFPWNDARTFEPLSRTAQDITGPLTIISASEPLREGSVAEIQFGNSRPLTMTFVSASWRHWSVIDPGEKVTAEVFALSEDPGPLVMGNLICGGDEPARFLVLFEHWMAGSHDIRMLAFSSTDVPFDLNSPGLCGTFGYQVDPVQ